MGLKPREVAEITLADFNLMLTGYYRRKENETDHLRHVLAFIRTFGGMGGQDFMSPQDLWPLEKDKAHIKVMILNEKMARELLRDFEALVL